MRALTRLAGLAIALSLFACLPSTAQSFRFVVYGDTRDGHEAHRNLVNLILKQNPEFVLQTGDLVHGSTPRLWSIYDAITAPMRARFPVYLARGNHDVGGHLYTDHVTQPFTSGNKLYYSFDRSGSHFISLAVDELTAYGRGSKQYAWLSGDLARAAAGSARHIFVFFHVAPYSIGSHGSDLDVRKELTPLFDRYGVTAVFNGHDHNYYRTVRNGIPYVVSGGGGAPLYPCNPREGAIPGDKWESVHHIVVCDLAGDRLTMTALREDGSRIEQFTTVHHRTRQVRASATSAHRAAHV